MKYSAEDFENAKFAEHPNGARAIRTVEGDYDGEWYYQVSPSGLMEFTDSAGMSVNGWVPVAMKPTITATALGQACDNLMMSEATGDWRGGVRRLAKEIGVEVISDPEPTNTERLADAIRAACAGLVFISPADRLTIAEELDAHGVKAGDDRE